MATVITPYVERTARLVWFPCTDSGTGQQKTVTAVTGLTSITVNGVVLTVGGGGLYGPIWTATSKQMATICYRIVSGPVTAGQTVTFTAPSGWLTTASGAAPAATNASVSTTYMGQLYGLAVGSIPPMAIDPATQTMPYGIGLGAPSWINTWGACWSRNAAKKMGRFVAGSGTSSVTYDSTDVMLLDSWTPGGTVTAFFWNSTLSPNAIENTAPGQLGIPTPQGSYRIYFNDVNAANGNAAVCWMASLSSPTNCTGVDPVALANQAASVATRTVSGTRVTITYPSVAYSSDPNYTNGYGLDLHIYMKSPLGLFGSGNTITNFGILMPGEGAGDLLLTDPLAPSQYMIDCLTSPSGKFPATIRFGEPVSFYGGLANAQNVADLVSPTSISWGVPPTPVPALSFARFYNTNSSDATYAWSSPKVYHPILGVTGSDSVGTYLDLTTLGATDCGKFIDVYGQGGNAAVVPFCVIELGTTAPHGYRTGDIVSLGFLTPNLILPITGGAVQTIANCTLNNGSGAITLGTSSTIASNSYWVFSGDSTGQAYKIVTGGTGTSFTIAPVYGGSNTTTATASHTAACSFEVTVEACIVVTGASTFVLYCGNTFGCTSGSTVQTVASTMQYDLTGRGGTVAWYPQGQRAPYEFAANFYNYFPGTIVHICINPYMSTACLQAIVDRMVPYMPNNSVLRVEEGLEHNNAGFPVGQLSYWVGTLMAYTPPLTTVNQYYITTNPSTRISPTLYREIGDYAYTLLSANAHSIMQAQFDTYGKGITIDRSFGSFQQDVAATTNMVAFACQALGSPSTGGLQAAIPMSTVMIAVYVDAPTDAVWEAAFNPAGGNLTMAEIHEMHRHYVYYGTVNQAYFSGHQAALATYTGPAAYNQIGGIPALESYEGGNEHMISGGTASQIHDGFYHPATLDTIPALLMSFQVGDPTVANTGLKRVTWFNAGGIWGGTGELQCWCNVIWHNQPINNGASNIGTTDQFTGIASSGNGKANDRQNASVQQFAILAYQDTANPAPPGGTPSFSITPTSVFDNQSSPITLTLVGTNTTWTSGSAVSIQNSVTGTTTATKGTWTDASGTAATLTITTGAGTGTFTVTVDTVVSMSITVTAATQSFTVSPGSVYTQQLTPVTLTLSGVNTTWTSGSTISIQNSVTGTTTAVKHTWTDTSGTSATLTVTTGAGTGTFTITVDGVVSPSISVAPALIPMFTVSPTAIQDNQATPVTLTLTGSATSWTSGSVVSIQNGTTTVTAGTWTALSETSATLTVTTGAGDGIFTITIDSIVSSSLIVGPPGGGPVTPPDYDEAMAYFSRSRPVRRLKRPVRRYPLG